MTQSRPDSLFHEFPAISRETWKKRVVADLGDKPFESIVWHTPDGFDLEPWYAHDEEAKRVAVPATKTANSWVNCHKVTVLDPKSANADALTSLSRDASALEFCISDPAHCAPHQLSLLFAGIDTSAIAIYFSGNLPPATELLETLLALSCFKATTGGFLAPPPLASKELDRKLFELADALPQFTLFGVDTTLYHEAGSTAAQEIALALGGTSDLLHRFIEAGIPAERIASAIELILPVGSSHFTELAKPRAVRALLPLLLKAYGATGSILPRLFARTSERNRSLLDPYTNLLRQTTESISAILGGYDTLQIAPFDNGLSVREDIASRITGNIHLVLKEEAWLDRVVDPASGSNYLETLTAKLAESGWSIFKTFEAAGGLDAAGRCGIVGSLIAASSSERERAVSKRKKTLIGVNRYPWPLTAEQEENSAAIMNAAETLPASNETAAFERLRLKTLSAKEHGGKIPSVVIWMVGDPAISFRQAAFCEDFFKCGGFDIAAVSALPIENSSYDTLLQHKPDIIVLCIARKDPVPSALGIATALANRHSGITIMAGKPPAEHESLLGAGIDSFIYTGVDVLEMLKSFQRKTGVQ
ncbi:MAG: methylmalonyl-CoA mutase [Chlorobiaceae bacterium]|nr:methylmalonyl-CoA mutase [Chlorobiaceae bacterium]